tara:strand:- start:1029 stop:1445 length:417 start_codon:yes stop_codon:yes gene_type:complete
MASCLNGKKTIREFRCKKNCMPSVTEEIYHDFVKHGENSFTTLGIHGCVEDGFTHTLLRNDYIERNRLSERMQGSTKSVVGTVMTDNLAGPLSLLKPEDMGIYTRPFGVKCNDGVASITEGECGRGCKAGLFGVLYFP